MPANLSPEYIKAEEKFRNAKNDQEKLEALHEMLATIPKHKGTEKMQADIKRRIAKFSVSAGKKGAKRTDFYFVPKEGAGQVVLVGLPNSGKSSLLRKMTNAHPVVGEYPFSTVKPIWGMLFFENIQIQIVDLPPIAKDISEGWVYGIIRNSNLTILVVDITDDNLIDNYKLLLELLKTNKIFPVSEYRENHEDPSQKYIRTIVAVNKADIETSGEQLTILKMYNDDNLTFCPVSSADSWDLKEFEKLIFDNLEIIRVYTKEPGKHADQNDPVILPKGSSLMDFAKNIHKDFAQNFKFARIWGDEVYPGQKIQHDFILRDGDIIELHIK